MESLLGYILREEWAKSRETMEPKGLGLALYIVDSGPDLCVMYRFGSFSTRVVIEPIPFCSCPYP